ncbi:MAG: hypothetical protein ACOWWH_09730 [Eubacteriaceae bacterium]
MSHDVISIILLGGLFYIVYAFEGINTNVNTYIRVGGVFKWILGYFVFKGNKFSLKSVVGQVGNLIAIGVGLTCLFLGYEDAEIIMLKLEMLNFIPVGIVAIFVNKW